MPNKVNPDVPRVCVMCPNDNSISKHHTIPKKIAPRFKRLWRQENKIEYNKSKATIFNQWVCKKHHGEIHKFFTNWELAWLVRQGIYPSIKEFKKELERRKHSKRKRAGWN